MSFEPRNKRNKIEKDIKNLDFYLKSLVFFEQLAYNHQYIPFYCIFMSSTVAGCVSLLGPESPSLSQSPLAPSSTDPVDRLALPTPRARPDSTTIKMMNSWYYRTCSTVSQLVQPAECGKLTFLDFFFQDLLIFSWEPALWSPWSGGYRSCCGYGRKSSAALLWFPVLCSIMVLAVWRDA